MSEPRPRFSVPEKKRSPGGWGGSVRAGWWWDGGYGVEVRIFWKRDRRRSPPGRWRVEMWTGQEWFFVEEDPNVDVALAALAVGRRMVGQWRALEARQEVGA